MGDKPVIDISAEHRQIVCAILQKHVPDREVWVFGSRVRGSAKPYSDLDLAVIGDEPLDLGVAADLADAFDESALPFKVDVVDWASTAPAFRSVIEATKVRIQHGVTGFREEPLPGAV